MKIQITEQQVITSYGIFSAGNELETQTFCKERNILPNQADAFFSHLVNDAKCAIRLDKEPIKNKIDKPYDTKQPMDNNSVRTQPDRQTSQLHPGKKSRNRNKR